MSVLNPNLSAQTKAKLKLLASALVPTSPRNYATVLGVTQTEAVATDGYSMIIFPRRRKAFGD